MKPGGNVRSREQQTIVDAVERRCHPRYLASLAKPREILRELVLTLAVQAARRELEFFPHGYGIDSSFRQSARQAKRRSKAYVELASGANNLGENREYLLREARRLDALGKQLFGLLKRVAQKNHDEGLSVLLTNILNLDPEFSQWEALAHVVITAYILAGREDETAHITAGALSIRARREWVFIDRMERLYGRARGADKHEVDLTLAAEVAANTARESPAELGIVKSIPGH